LKKIYFSLHKLPKQQSTSFWSQGILGVNCEWPMYDHYALNINESSLQTKIMIHND
jgi:hypothetical protein